ncbi:MAG: vitamin K epoxide reductase family protein [Acidobacteriota bacterium]
MIVLVVVLSICGLLISSYFTAVAYRWMRPDSPYVPSLCRMGSDTCSRIVDTPRARLLGVPNSVLGFFYYAALIGAFAGGFWREPVVQWILLAASLATVAMGVILTYSLFFVTRVKCPLCLFSHAANVVLFVCLWILFR